MKVIFFTITVTKNKTKQEFMDQNIILLFSGTQQIGIPQTTKIPLVQLQNVLY